VGTCHFKGTLPAEWSVMSELNYFDLSINSLEGTLPAAWSALLNVTKM
jgi:hypothetical protein